MVDILRRSGCLDVEDVARDRSRTSVVEAAVDGFLNARAYREVMRTVADVDDIVLDIAIPRCKAAVDEVIHSAALYDNMIVLCTAGCTDDVAARNEPIHQPSCMEIDPVPHGIAAAVGDAAYGGVDISFASCA